ncbi:MAG: hypothetical protein NTW10_05480 [Bacteroidetes bacterium]|nr:hypothetical protein [Bacteroidota bacterium]
MINKTTTLWFFLMFSIVSFLTEAQTTRTVGSGGNYATLKAAFDAINTGTITGSINLQVISNTTETASASLNASGSGSANYSSVTIYPTGSGYTISGNLNTPLIDLNGADNLILDGRVNATGTSKDLTITNTSTGAAASTLRFIESAENNTVKYCTVKGSTTNPVSGIFYFSTATAGNGNDGNTVDNNNITSDAAGRPVNAIYALGSAGYENSGNIISNNNVFNFLRNGTASNGINIASNNTAWTISGNSFYETTSFAPAASVTYNIILINNTSGTGFILSGNSIGGNAALCSGTWTKTAAFDNIFYALNLNVGTSPATSIQNNTIRNFAWSNSGAAAWTGIQITSGSADIGTGTGNSIGAATGTESIIVTAGANGSNVYGMTFSGGGTINCQNNNIGSITAANASSANASNIYGINRATSGTTTLSNNTIGSTSTANSINANSPSTGNAQSVFGISNTTAGTFTVNNNTIANLTNGTTNAATGTPGLINGIASSAAVNTISNNTVRNLTISNANNASTSAAAICGITLTGTNANKTITGNIIYNLSNTYDSFDGSVIGLYFGTASSTHTVSGNFIHSLSVTGASSTAASLYGILIYSGATTYYNNIINLGGNTATTLYGIYETGSASQTCNFYFNTIYIGGSLGAGVTNKSYAFYSAGSANTRNFRDNIFENARSTASGASLHYAAFFNYAVSAALTLDYNDYYTPGTGGVPGYYNSADVTSLPLVPGTDANSLAINPGFASPGGLAAVNYIPSSSILAGTTISTISTDFLLVNRPGTPTMGALEGTLNLNIDVYKSGVFQSTYLRLKDAFDKINNGTHTGNLEIRIKANTTEIASCVLYQSGYSGAGGTSNYSAVSIYPTVSGITVTGTLDATLIDLNGADNVTIDGRVNAAGLIKDLIITNTSTGISASTFRFLNSAENNTVKYCTLKGSGTNASKGVITFSTASSGNGNDGNIIDNNNITSDAAGRPSKVIYSYGTTGYENSENTISNNTIYNFLRTGTVSYGIDVSGASVNWTVTGNSFYETSSFIPTAINSYHIIHFSTLSNHTISGNYIGGSAPQCGGAAWTISACFPTYFCGIYVEGGAIAASSVQNNIIRNINYTSTEDNPLDGIFINAGNVNVTGNTIGAATGNGSIIVTTPIAVASTTITGGAVTAITLIYGGSGYTTAPPVTFSLSGSTTPATATATISGGVITAVNLLTGGSGYTSAPSVVFDGQSNNYSTSHGMIQNSTGTVTISNNNIGSITTVGSDYYSHGFETVYIRGASGTTTLSNNLIGSLTTSNSIYTSSSAASSLQKQDVYGLYGNTASGTIIMTGNTVANLTNAYSGTNSASRARGICTISGTNTIQNNTVRNISSASAQISSMASASVIGLVQTSPTIGTTQTVTGNTVCNLSNTNATVAAVVSGIYYSGPVSGSHVVSGNFIHSLSLSTSNTGGEIDGIVLNGGLTTCANNIINLGTGIATGYKIYGIPDQSGATNNNNIYFNSVYIGGSVSSGATSSTAALWNPANTSTRNYRNNILENARSGGTTGKHYAIYLAGTTGLTIDYNDYFANGINGVLGFLGADKTTLASWRSATGQDANSLNINPGFSSPGGISPLDYYTSALLPGIAGTGITTDYAGLTRGPTPTMGALETNNYTWKGGTSTDFNTASNWLGGSVPLGGANIIFDAAPLHNCILDQDRSVGDITNAQGTYMLVVNGHQMILNGSLIFSNGAKIDATATSSLVVFSGTTAQSIPTGSFLSNIVDGLTVSNNNGLTLNGDLTIPGHLTLTNGTFLIGANTLILNGTIVKTSGSLTGGSSSNIIIGGSGAATTLPGVILNDFTLNRASGITLAGSVNIGGTLTLTSGTLTVGANTLTISGNSPVRTTGNIDIGNAGATLAFTNSSAITLPASILAGVINNLTINGTGGITAASDFTINGILNLQSSNPLTTKGSLDLWDGSLIKTLTMGANATTTGIGDVTGIVKRTSFESSKEYSFGNPFTTMTIAGGGTMPDDISFRIRIGTAPFWKSTAVERNYDIVRTGGSGTTVTFSLHYLDTELQSNTESNLVIWDYHADILKVEEHGKANQNMTQNWVAISNRSITYFGTAFDTHLWGLSNNEFATFTWQGTPSSDWDDPNNWSGGIIPSDTSNVVIPDAVTTAHDPLLPATASVKTMTIQSSGILEGGTATTLTVTGSTGAWLNLGMLNPGTSTVIFTHANATMADPTDFYNVTIADGAGLTLSADNIMRIAGALTLQGTGILRAALLPNTIEFNGTGPTQVVINPNGLTTGYYNLILSGSGAKTFPLTPLSIAGDLTVSGTASVTVDADIIIGGNLMLEDQCTFSVSPSVNVTVSGNITIW